jgi:hypothetical protein
MNTCVLLAQAACWKFVIMSPLRVEPPRLPPGGRPPCVRSRSPANRYTLTADGARIAIFYTKVYNRSSSHSPLPTDRKPCQISEPQCLSAIT